MKQRVCIAMAILFRPKLIIADESTSALDVVSQRVVLQTLLKVRSDFNTSIVLIGHDLALQAQVADRIGIMFGGHLVEVGPTVDIFDRPAHPYTRRLIASVPSIQRQEGIPDIALPDEAERESWRREELPLIEVSGGHFARATSAAV
jgi:ABC-type dipeptide/oligopeptide/nickel transport system ATPase component